MSIAAASIILALVIVLALLVAAPFLYFSRKRRAKQSSLPQTFMTTPMTWRQAAPGLILVAALMASFATAYVAPDSWLGSRVQTLEGKGWLFIFLTLLFYSVERAIYGLPWRRRNHGGRS